MFFLIEKDNPQIDAETFLWSRLAQKTQHASMLCTLSQLPEVLPQMPQETIPLGSIDFTNKVLQQKYGVKCMNPVEIPLCLRSPEFLGRNYKICRHDEIPSKGSYFIKDATQMKGLVHLGNVERLNRHALIPEHLYVVSEVVDILSEYRVYIINGEIYAIEYYNGNATILPDAKKIQRMNLMYMMHPDYPLSYTMDVMVTEDGTFLTEVHPTIFSCGLYTTILSPDFLSGYADGLRYVLNHNTPAQIS